MLLVPSSYLVSLQETEISYIPVSCWNNMETRSAFVIVIMKYLSILKLQLLWAVHLKSVPEFLVNTIGYGAAVHWSACEKAAILFISGVCVLLE